MDETVQESERIDMLWVLGEITQFTNSKTDIEINVMHQSGSKFWKWPTSQDKIYYERKSIIRIIDPPKVAGTCGQFLYEHL